MNSSRTASAGAAPRGAVAPWWTGAIAGLLATAAGVSAATGLAALLTGVPSPIISVGNQAVDNAPPFLKDFAVRQFGTADKAVLISGVMVTLALLAAASGVIGRRRPRLALGIITFVGLVALGAAAIDRTATASRAITLLPALLALVVVLTTFGYLLNALRFAPKADDDLQSSFDRRKFLQGVAGAGALVIIGGLVGKAFGNAAAAASRAALRIARPSDPAPAIPTGTDLGVEGISSYITSNKKFYRVDTALQVPDVPAEGWNLRVHGMVDQELNLSFRDLMAMPLVERRITLTCVSNEVGGPYVGNASWIGVPVADVLRRAGVKSGADAVKTTSADDWTCGTPLSALTDGRNAIIAIAMNGEPLPLIHGFPARMVVPGLYGYVSATKWLVDLEVTRFADFKAYWTTREYDAEAPIKMSSRIDVPRAFQSFKPDAVRVGGVAWAQTKGIKKVEVKVDDGDWNEARLGSEDNLETWRQWSWKWDDATPGRHTLTVRATDATGFTQSSDRAKIRPNGTTGWHNVQFAVE